MSTGVDDDKTLRANPRRWATIKSGAGWSVRQARHDVEVSQVWESPIYFSPSAPSGLSFRWRTGNGSPVKAPMYSRCFQPFVDQRGSGRQSARHAARTRCTCQTGRDRELVRRRRSGRLRSVVWTIEHSRGRNAEMAPVWLARDSRNCSACHPAGTDVNQGVARNRVKPMFCRPLRRNDRHGRTDLCRKLKSLTKMKLLLKGSHPRKMQCWPANVELTRSWCRTKRSRATRQARTIDILPEVVEAVGAIPVFVDGDSVRHGRFQTLALGARGSSIGRPYVWGLAAVWAGTAVERVIDNSARELAMTKRNCGGVDGKFNARLRVRNGRDLARTFQYSNLGLLRVSGIRIHNFRPATTAP